MTFNKPRFCGVAVAATFALASLATAPRMARAQMTPPQSSGMGAMSRVSERDAYMRRFVSYNLDAASVRRYKAIGFTDDEIKGASNLALRTGVSLDYYFRRIRVGGESLTALAAAANIPVSALTADIPGYGMDNGAMVAPPMMNAGTAFSNDTRYSRVTGGMTTTPPMSGDRTAGGEAALRLDLATPVTNTTTPATPPPADLRIITPAEKAAADRGAQDTLRRADPQMRSVLEALQALGPKPLFTLTPEEGRQQPTIADAVKAVLVKQGKSTDPEAVASVRDTTMPGPGGDVPVRVYTPSGSGPFPVIVYVHGGGFVIATINTYDSSARALCNAAGAVVVSVDYRRAPEFKLPAAHEDCYAVLQYVANNPQTVNGDASKIAVAGESAGGNVAIDLCQLARARGGKMPVHQVLVYPVADGVTNAPSDRENYNAIPLGVPGLQWFFNYILPNPAFAQSPLVTVTKLNPQGLPPATIIGADIDPLKSEGQQLAARLRQGGVPVRYRLYPGVTHEFFGTGAVVDKGRDAVAYAADGLKAAFGTGPAATP